MKIVLLGAPGAGKGTQATLIAETYDIPHISTGEIFRKNIAERTPIGIVAKGYIDGGNLVPDDVTLEIVKDRLKEDDCKDGYILDGFPRTVCQAEAMSAFSEPDVVIDVAVPIENLTARLTGRRVCRDCGESYHISMLGGMTSCGRCGGTLIRRDDDNEQTVSERIAVYTGQTEPLIAYYTQKGLLRIVDGDMDKDEVFSQIKAVLGSL